MAESKASRDAAATTTAGDVGADGSPRANGGFALCFDALASAIMRTPWPWSCWYGCGNVLTAMLSLGNNPFLPAA